MKQKTYDVIFARDVIEHFTKDEILEVLTLIFSSLKDRGVFILQCLNAESPFMGRILYGDFTHEMTFTRNNLHQILTTTGFKHIDIPLDRFLGG
jgi:cyclopropane fatty-acyl-phospholipid synthase-like methyltransferase